MECDMLYNKPSPDELYHEGRLGMKWGKRNGPPYPLGASQLSSAEKKEGGVSKSAKARDGNETKSSSEKKEKPPSIQKTMKSGKLKKMSDKDLNASTERLKREAEYKRLMNEVYGNQFSKDMKSQISKGVSEAVGNTAKKLTNVATVKGVNALAKAMGYQGDLIGLDDNSDGINKALRGVYKNVKDLGQDVKKKVDESKKDDNNDSDSSSNKPKKTSKTKSDRSSKKDDYTDAPYKEIWYGTVEGTGSSTASTGYSAFTKFAHQTVVSGDRYIEDGRKYLEDKFKYPAVV